MSKLKRPHVAAFYEAIATLFGGTVPARVIYDTYQSANRLNLCSLSVSQIADGLNDELQDFAGALTDYAESRSAVWYAVQGRPKLSGRTGESRCPWRRFGELERAGLLEALQSVWHDLLQRFAGRVSREISDSVIDFWRAVDLGDAALLATTYLKAKLISSALRQSASPLLGLLENGQLFVPQLADASLHFVTDDLFDAELSGLGDEHELISDVAQVLAKRGQPQLLARLHLLNGDIAQASELLEQLPKSACGLEFGWIAYLSSDYRQAEIHLAQLLAPNPAVKPGYLAFARLLLGLCLLRRDGASAFSSSSTRSREIDMRSDVGSLSFLSCWDDPSVAHVDAVLRDQVGLGRWGELLLLALRRFISGRDLPATFRSRLDELAGSTDQGSWGWMEVQSVLDGKPTLGLGLGALRGGDSAWQDALLRLAGDRAVGKRAPKEKPVFWRLALDEERARIVRIGFSLSERNEKIHLPWSYKGATTNWDKQDLQVYEAVRTAVAATKSEQLTHAQVTALLPTFVEHSRVTVSEIDFESVDRNVSLVIESPRLVVTPDGESTVLRFDPPLAKGTHRAELSGEKLRVTMYSPEQVEMASAIGLGLRVPKEAKEQLEAIMPRLIARAPVSQTTIEQVAQAVDVVSDSQVHVILEPSGAGLSFQLQVRPIDGGSFYEPGHKPLLVTHLHEGKLLRAKRNLTAELRAKAAFLEACPKLAGALHNDFAGDALDLQLALEVTLELRMAKDVVVHWPKNQHVNAIGELTENSVTMRANLHGGWFELRADVQVDQGRVLELSKMLREVAASQSRFIQLDDHTFVALSETLHRRMQELAAIAELAGDQVKVATALAPLLQDDVLPQGDALELLARQRTLEKYSATVPTSLRATLRPYQLDGFQWLARMMRWGVGAVLADDMGLGKTIMTLALLLHRLRVKGQEGPVLIVVPTSLIANWQREAATFAPKLRMQTWRKIRDTPEVELGLRDVVVISYGMLARASEDVARRRWGAVVFDEAHALKNPQTQRAKAAATIDAGFRLALSGTPLENHLGELWSLFRILNPGMLGSAQRFTQRFITPIERDHDVRTLARLRRIVSPFMLRRRKEDVLKDLPERIEIIREVHLDRDERALYEAVRRKVLEDLSKSSSSHNPGERKLRVLAELMKMRRLCCHPALVSPEWTGAAAKLDALMEVVHELRDAGHKALIFSQFVDVLTQVRKRLEKHAVSYQYLDGQTSEKGRQNAVDAFQAGEGDVFLISLKAGGTGLNLTAADYVVILDPWWNPAVEDQASARAHRIGQKKVVTVVRLVCQGTIEEKIIKMHHKKRELAASVLADADSTNTSVDLDAMMELLSSS